MTNYKDISRLQKKMILPVGWWWVLAFIFSGLLWAGIFWGVVRFVELIF